VSYGVAAREVAAGERLVDDGDVGGGAVFVLVPETAPEERDAKQLKIGVADEVDAGILIVDSLLALELDARDSAIVGWCGGLRDGGHADAGNFGDFFAHLFEVGGSFGPVAVGIGADGHVDGHDVVRIVAERRVHHAPKALDGCASAGKHEQRERDLGGDGGVVGGAHADASGDSASSGLHDSAQVGLGETQGGPESKRMPVSRPKPPCWSFLSTRLIWTMRWGAR